MLGDYPADKTSGFGEVVPRWVNWATSTLEWGVPSLWKEGREIRQRIRVELTLERDNRAYIQIGEIHDMLSDLKCLAEARSGVPAPNNGLGNNFSGSGFILKYDVLNSPVFLIK